MGVGQTVVRRCVSYGNRHMNSRNKRTIAIVTIILAVAVIGGLTLTACSQNPAVGFWIVEKVTAGDVVMNEQDAESIGLNAVGTVKLQNSGKCEVNLLGEEAQGTWEQAPDGTITITYGKDLTLSGSIDDKGIMTLTDPQGAEYVLDK